LGCFWLLIQAKKYTGTRWMMGRSVLKNLKQSTLLTFYDVCTAYGIKINHDFTVDNIDNVIKFKNGSRIHLLDLAWMPSDPNYERIGSTEFTGAFVDEASQITHKCKEAITGRLRYKLDENGLIGKTLMTCNPAKNWIYTTIFKPWKDGVLPDDMAFIQALAKDNHHNPESYLKRLEALTDRTMKERLWFGNWEYEDHEASLFIVDDINDLFTNAAEAGERYITCDVARLGTDKTVITVWDGLKCFHIEQHAITTIPQVVDRIKALQSQFQVKNSHTIVDEGGVGGGVVDLLGCKGFVGASSAIQDKQRTLESEYKVNYQNLRAQCFYKLGDYVRDGKIRIECDTAIRDLIIMELEQIKGKDVDKDGKLKIIAKDEIKQHLGHSPDYADALSMRLFYELEEPIELNIRVL